MCKTAAAIALTAVLAAAAPRQAGAEKLMTVQVHRGQVRNGPSFLAPVITVLDYGTGVRVVEEQNGWVQVQTAGGAGWMHGSALTAKTLTLTGGKTQAVTDARSDEMALAGKGFNRDVENQYRSRRGSAGYAWIDRIEQLNLTPTQLHTFLQQGAVVPEGGRQ